MKNSLKTISLTVPDNIIEKLVSLSEKQHCSIDELICKFVLVYDALGSESVWAKLFEYGEETAQSMEIENEEELFELLNNQDLNSGLDGTFTINHTSRSPAEEALRQAQELVYEAWESSGKRCIELAYKALSLSEDCADAHVLLAEETSTSLEEAVERLEKGVKAGERAIGQKSFKEDVGYFWGLIETRPYMRTRFALAERLWVLGRKNEAIEHFTDLLRLNPNDNQGVRHLLINYLLEENRNDDAAALIKNFEDEPFASTLYSRALLTYRLEGLCEVASDQLKEALQQNPYVPAYLLRVKKLPKRLPDFMGCGDENEAITYVADAMMVWALTEGALAWLANAVDTESSKSN